MLSSSLWKNGPAYPKNIGLLHQQQQHFKHNLDQHPTSLRTVLHQHSMPFTSMDTKAIETNPLPIHPTDKICNEVGSHYTHCTIRLLRITSYVLRFIGQLRKHTNHKPDSAYSLRNLSNGTWQSHFKEQSSYRISHKLLRLFLDDQHLIRCPHVQAEFTMLQLVNQPNFPFCSLTVIHSLN